MAKKDVKGELVPVAGAVAGGYGGYKATRGAKRAVQGSDGVRAGYKFSRMLGQTKQKSALEGAKAGVAGLKAMPKSRIGMKGALVTYAGSITGAAVASNEYEKRKKKPIKKSDGVSAFGIKHD